MVSLVHSGSIDHIRGVREGQRTVFRNPRGNQRYYFLYHSEPSNSQIVAEWSSDGITWNNARQIVHDSGGTNNYDGQLDLEIYDDGSQLVIFMVFWTPATVLTYIRGTIADSSDTIVWGASQTVVNGTQTDTFLALCSITRTANNELVILYNDNFNSHGNDFSQLHIIGSDGIGSAPAWSSDTIIDDPSGSTNNDLKANLDAVIRSFGSAYGDRIVAAGRVPESTDTSTYQFRIFVYDWIQGTGFTSIATDSKGSHVNYAKEVSVVIDDNNKVHSVHFIPDDPNDGDYWHSVYPTAGALGTETSYNINATGIGYTSETAWTIDRTNNKIYFIFKRIGDTVDFEYKSTDITNVSWGSETTVSSANDFSNIVASEDILSGIHVGLSITNTAVYFHEIGLPIIESRYLSYNLTKSKVDSRYLTFGMTSQKLVSISLKYVVTSKENTESRYLNYGVVLKKIESHYLSYDMDFSKLESRHLAYQVVVPYKAIPRTHRGTSRQVFKNVRGNKRVYKFFIDGIGRLSYQWYNGTVWGSDIIIHTPTGNGVVSAVDIEVSDTGTLLDVYIALIDYINADMIYIKGTIGDSADTITFSTAQIVDGSLAVLGFGEKLGIGITRTYNGRLVIGFLESQNSSFMQSTIIGASDDGSAPTWSGETIHRNNTTSLLYTGVAMVHYGPLFPDRFSIGVPLSTNSAAGRSVISQYEWDGVTMTPISNLTYNLELANKGGLSISVDSSERVYILNSNFLLPLNDISFLYSTPGFAGVAGSFRINPGETDAISIVKHDENKVYLFYHKVADSKDFNYITVPDESINFSAEQVVSIDVDVTAISSSQTDQDGTIHFVTQPELNGTDLNYHISDITIKESRYFTYIIGEETTIKKTPVHRRQRLSARRLTR